MCEIVDNYAREYAKEVAKEAIQEMAAEFFKNGVDFDIVCRSINNLSAAELRAIYERVKGIE